MVKTVISRYCPFKRTPCRNTGTTGNTWPWMCTWPSATTSLTTMTSRRRCWPPTSRYNKHQGTNTVKKVSGFSRPQPGCDWPNTPWSGIIKLFPARESLVRDIPAGDGKTADLFLQCMAILPPWCFKLFPSNFLLKFIFLMWFPETLLSWLINFVDGLELTCRTLF